MPTIEDRFKIRRGTAYDLASVNEVPLKGEFVWETDQGLVDGKYKLKIGDGVTHYNDLAYLQLGGGVETIAAGSGIDVDNTDPQNPVISATGGGGSGDVVGPASAVDGDLALFDGITGKLIKSGGALAAAVRGVVLAGLSLATSTAIAATDTVLQAFGKLQAQITDNLLPAGYIDGLKMVWVSGTALTVTSGAAYIPGSSKVLRVTSDIAKTGLSLSASTWYHVYLYDNAGAPDVEIVTTAPAEPYNGTARSKAGDTSRRYMGSVLTDGSSNIRQFKHAGQRISYLFRMDGAPARTLSNGDATTATSISCAGIIPVTATHVQMRALSTGSVASRWSNQDIAGASTDSGSGTFYVMSLSAGSQAVLDFPVSSSKAILYWLISAGSGIYCDVLGYVFER